MSLRHDLDGLRLAKPGDPTIYLMDQGRKRGITDPMTYNGLFRDWNTVVQDVDVNEIDNGPVVDPRNILVQGYGEATIYLLDQGKKRGITSPATMDRYDFSWYKVHHVPVALLQQINDGPVIAWPEK